MNFHVPAGSTELDPDEASALLIDLTTQSELNEFEQINIDEAWEWAQQSRIVNGSLLKLNTIKLIHLRMFDKTWKWAGKFRLTEKNIGVEVWKIETMLYDMLEDVKVWIKFSSYPPDEISARFHHRLVSIHAFVNGNGRHGRLVADLLSLQLGLARPTWGMASYSGILAREKYLLALRDAGAGDYAPLVTLLRS